MKRHVAPVPPPSLRASRDRWLFGYADIVTLLFACFAGLYATETLPLAKGTPEPVAPAPVVRPLDASGHKALEQHLSVLANEHAGETSLDLHSSARGLVLSLAETGSFPPGRAELSSDARQVMLTVADALRDVPNLIRVEGHTDDTPIHTLGFASNWELSSARATELVRFLIEQGGLAGARLSAAGFAEYRPRVANDSPAARARNRRVDLVVLDNEAATREEPAR